MGLRQSAVVKACAAPGLLMQKAVIGISPGAMPDTLRGELSQWRCLVTARQSAGKELAKDASRLVGHSLAIAVGLGLMIAGIAMGVTLVMLPVGIPVGFAGLLVFLWGLVGQAPA